MTTRDQLYITIVRQYNRQIWDGINALLALQREYNALDYGTTLEDGTGENAGITRQMVSAVVFVTANALQEVLAAGSATNMGKLL